jgi:hypothetical protein
MRKQATKEYLNLLTREIPNCNLIELGQGSKIMAVQNCTTVDHTVVRNSNLIELGQGSKSMAVQNCTTVCTLVPNCDSIEIGQGTKFTAGPYDSTLSHTWVHREVAMNIAQWISPEFSVRVNRWVAELLIVGKTAVDHLPREEVENIRKFEVGYSASGERRSY